jgi:hypothetical protein
MSSARGGASARAPRTPTASTSRATSSTTSSRRSQSPDANLGEGVPGIRRLVHKRFINDVFKAVSGTLPCCVSSD